MKKLLCLFAICFLLISGFSQSTVSFVETKQAFVTTGQSNMKGTEPYLKYFLRDYLIITCSVGKTSVLEWQKGTPNYENCLGKVGTAKINGYEIIGMFHYQGEKDTKIQTTSRSWDVLTMRFFDDFRHDIGASNIRVVYAQLGYPIAAMDVPYWNRVMIKQTNLRSLDPTLRMIVTKDITPYCRNIHWCPDGYKEIAKRFILSYFAP